MIWGNVNESEKERKMMIYITYCLWTWCWTGREVIDWGEVNWLISNNHILLTNNNEFSILISLELNNCELTITKPNQQFIMFMES